MSETKDGKSAGDENEEENEQESSVKSEDAPSVDAEKVKVDTKVIKPQPSLVDTTVHDEEEFGEQEEETRTRKKRHRYFYNFLKPCELTCHIPHIANWNLFLSMEKYIVENKLRELPLQVNRNEIEFLQVCNESLYWLIFAKRSVQSKYNTDMKYYLIKSYKKKNVINWDLIKQIKYERHVLKLTKFPFIGHLEFYLSDQERIYFGFPFIAGQTLRTYLLEDIRLDEQLIKFYTAQIVLALEYLHHMCIVYRNLKPENILIQPNGYLKLIGFMKAKYIKCRTFTQCITLEYSAPECINGLRGYGFAADWWSLGVNIYEMGTGFSPFYCGIEEKTANRILNGVYKMPVYFSYELKHLLKQLLTVDLGYRAGVSLKGIDTIKRHKWFDKMSWMDILNRDHIPPFVPYLRNPLNERVFCDYHDDGPGANSYDEFCEF